MIIDINDNSNNNNDNNDDKDGSGSVELKEMVEILVMVLQNDYSRSLLIFPVKHCYEIK